MDTVEIKEGEYETMKRYIDESGRLTAINNKLGRSTLTDDNILDFSSLANKIKRDQGRSGTSDMELIRTQKMLQIKLKAEETLKIVKNTKK